MTRREPRGAPSSGRSTGAGRFRQALALHRQGKIAEAEAIYRELLRAQPDHAAALHLLAVLEAQAGRPAAALQRLDRLVALKPDNAEAWANRGAILRTLNRPADALSCFERAAALNPGQAGVWASRGNVLRDLGRLNEAVASYDKAAALGPGDAALWSNRGSILHALNRLDEALASCDEALALKPGFAEAWSNRGNALRDLGRIAAALESHRRSQALKPDYAAAHWNEALCLLLAGDYAEGWRKFEWRWQREPLKSQRRDFAAPRWTGAEDLAGKSILLHAEQGFGDTIQFCRYAPLVAARGARVILEVQPALQSLLGSLAGVERVIARGEALPGFDFHCPLLSLPLAFGTTLESVPAEIPYLRPDAQAVARWTSRLTSRKRPLVAVAWAGNPAQINDRNRSLALAPAGAAVRRRRRFREPAEGLRRSRRGGPGPFRGRQLGRRARRLLRYRGGIVARGCRRFRGQRRGAPRRGDGPEALGNPGAGRVGLALADGARGLPVVPDGDVAAPESRGRPVGPPGQDRAGNRDLGAWRKGRSHGPRLSRRGRHWGLPIQ
jgi:Flp pilus assembly protein TadD